MSNTGDDVRYNNLHLACYVSEHEYGMNGVMHFNMEMSIS